MDNLLGDSLLSFLTRERKIEYHPENVASASLYYILETNDSALRRFLAVIKENGFPFDDLRFELQKTIDLDTKSKSRFDISGRNETDNICLIVENKFNACITLKDIDYLKCFDDKKGALLFIVSHSDFQTAWTTIKSTLPTDKLKIIDECSSLVNSLKIGNSIIMLTTWKHLLEQIIESTENDCCKYEQPSRNSTKDTKPEEISIFEKKQRRINLMADINQLSRLCNEQDRVNFIEFSDDKSITDIPKRIINLLDLIDDVCEILENENDSIGISKYGYKQKNGRGTTSREMAINIYNYCRLTFDCKLWLDSKNNNPLWLQIQDRTVKGTPNQYTDEQKEVVLAKFKDLAFTDRDWIYVPLTIKRNAKYYEVVKDLKEQILEIANILPKKH